MRHALPSHCVRLAAFPRKGNSMAIQTALNLDTLPDSGYISCSTLAAALETSLTTVWRWSKSGRLPKPHRLGEGTTRWRVGEVRAALSKLAA